MTIVPQIVVSGVDTNAIMATFEAAARMDPPKPGEDNTTQHVSLRRNMLEYCQHLAQTAFNEGIAYGHRNPPEK